jgi:hypothetical protein
MDFEDCLALYMVAIDTGNMSDDGEGRYRPDSEVAKHGKIWLRHHRCEKDAN